MDQEAWAMTSLPLLTNSSARTFRRCAREYQFRYELAVEPVGADAEALRFGTLVHRGLEAWWIAKRDGETPIFAALDAMALEADPYTLARAAELLRGYDARWGAEDLEVLHVEVEFRAPLTNPETGAPSRTWQRAGKLDAVVLHPSGRIYVVEHKTASEDITAGSGYWERLRIDSQVSGYLAAGAALEMRVDGCLYDVIGKPALRPSAIPLTDDDGAKVVLDHNGLRVRTKDGKKWRESASSAEGYVLQTRPETPEEYGQRVREHIAADPDRYYQRGEVVRLEDEADDAAFDVWQIGRNIRDAQIAKRWPRNPDACIRFGRRCAMFDVCTRVASIDDPTRFRRMANPHRELTAEAADAA
jgi:hypothetical protein